MIERQVDVPRAAASGRRRAAAAATDRPHRATRRRRAPSCRARGRTRSSVRWNAEVREDLAADLGVDRRRQHELDARPLGLRPLLVRHADRDERPLAEHRAGSRSGRPRSRACRRSRGDTCGAENAPNTARSRSAARVETWRNVRELRHALRHRDPRRLERERAPQVVLRDDLVADLGVRERAAPQRGRAIGAQADRLIERARRLVRLARGTAARGRAPSSRARAAGTHAPRARTATRPRRTAPRGTARCLHSPARLRQPGSRSHEVPRSAMLARDERCRRS